MTDDGTREGHAAYSLDLMPFTMRFNESEPYG